MEKVEGAQELAKRVTEADLMAYVSDYLERFSVGHRYRQVGNDPHFVELQLSHAMATHLDEFLSVERLTGKTSLSNGQSRKCRFLNRISERAKPGEEIIHQFHPLIRFISKDLRARNEHFYPIVAVAVEAAPDVPKGDIRLLYPQLAVSRRS
ncbi:MAG: hypothetical protein IPL06_19180 [Betaproteobacteria bacterium]|nr:hypothetical protein [Betaproteobacteria bacterium]